MALLDAFARAAVHDAVPEAQLYPIRSARPGDDRTPIAASSCRMDGGAPTARAT